MQSKYKYDMVFDGTTSQEPNFKPTGVMNRPGPRVKPGSCYTCSTITDGPMCQNISRHVFNHENNF